MSLGLMPAPELAKVFLMQCYVVTFHEKNGSFSCNCHWQQETGNLNQLRAWKVQLLSKNRGLSEVFISKKMKPGNQHLDALPCFD